MVSAIVGRLEAIPGLLEIGPGPGVLTSPLSERCHRMVALEIDRRMVAALAESAPRADIRLEDALLVDLMEILAELPSPRAVVSNLPYFITGPLVAKIAEARSTWDKAVLMMQKEVADRIVAGPGNSDRGSLSVYLQALFSIERVCDVPPEAFLPPPKVSSTVLEFVPLVADYPAEFFDFVRAGFKQPRKTLANNLQALLPRDEILRRLEAAGLDERIRPHMLTQDQWISVSGIRDGFPS